MVQPRKREKDKQYDCGNYPVDKIEEFFSNRLLPVQIDLNAYTHIKDVKLFVSSHIAYLKTNNRNVLFFYYYKRLVELKDVILKMDDW